MNPLRTVVIVGAGLAGLRAASTLRAEGFDGQLTLLGAEPHRPYDRPSLSKTFLTGQAQQTDLTLPHQPSLDIQWHLGDPGVALDVHRRTVSTATGREFPFDGLVLATGSRNRELPGLVRSAAGVGTLRSLDDALALRAELLVASRLVIVGGGLVAVEVAASASALGLPVDIVCAARPLHRFGTPIAGECARLLAEHGVTVHCGRSVIRFAGGTQVTGVELSDGTALDADAVLVAIGAEPATAWLPPSILGADGGVRCDATLAVRGTTRIVAAGDVARWPHGLFDGEECRLEHWSNAVEQGAAAARTLLHGPSHAREFAAVPSFWSDHFGVRLRGVGLPGLADRHEINSSISGAGFTVAGYRGRRLVSATGYGDTRALAPYRAQLARSTAPTMESGVLR